MPADLNLIEQHLAEAVEVCFLNVLGIGTKAALTLCNGTASIVASVGEQFFVFGLSRRRIDDLEPLRPARDGGNFAPVATIAALGGGWAVTANEYDRFVALALLALFGAAWAPRAEPILGLIPTGAAHPGCERRRHHSAARLRGRRRNLTRPGCSPAAKYSLP